MLWICIELVVGEGNGKGKEEYVVKVVMAAVVDLVMGVEKGEGGREWRRRKGWMMEEIREEARRRRDE